MSDEPRGNEHSGSDSSGSDQPIPDQPSAEQPSPEQPTAEQPSPEQPGPAQPSAQQPGEVQQPWDRPRRWNADRLDATRVDDLLARLRTDDEESKKPRRRRRAGPEAPAPKTAAAPEDTAAVAPQTPAAAHTPAAPEAPESTAPETPTEVTADQDPEATVIVNPGQTYPQSGAQPNSGPSTSGTAWPASSAVGAGRVSPIDHDLDSNTEILPVITAKDTEHEDADAVREALRASLVGAAGSSAAEPLGEPAPAKAERAQVTPNDQASEREPHHYLKRSASVILALVSALVLGATGVYANIVGNAEDGLKQNQVSLNLGAPSAGLPVQPTDAAGSSAAAAAPAVYAPENFLLVGSDTRAGANNIDGGEASLGDEANTDSLMVLHLSGDRQQITVISLPRDLWAANVPCQSYNAATNTYSGEASSNDLTQQHINAFYGVGGPQCLVDAVTKLTNLQITRYIQIDFSGFSAMVDALGGVTINACKPIIDEQLATVLPNAGVQVINGEQALNLARARKVIGDDGVSDPARIHRQQLILSAILRQAKSTDTLLDPGKLNAFVQAFVDNTATKGVDFQTLLGLAESVGDLDPSKVTFYTLPTVPAEPADERGSMDIDQARADLLLNAIRTDTPIPGTNPEPDPAATSAAETTAAASNPTLTIAPDQINLTVVNAADADGVAGDASTQLKAFGYSVPEASLKRLDANQTQPGITVEYATGNEAAALTVAASAPGATLAVKDDLGDEVRLILGTSYKNNLVSAAVGDAIAPELLSQVPAGSAGNVITPTAGTDTSDVSSADASAVVAEIPQVNAASGDCL